MTNLYSVSYNTNNSTGGTTPPTQSASSNSTTYTFKAPTAEEYGLARTGYTFMGWAESPNAVFKEYEGGATISLSNTNPTKTLYAVWAKPYTLQYSKGDGSGIPPAAETLMLGHLPYTYTPTGSQSNIFKVGHIANGWSEVTFTDAIPSPIATPTWIASNSTNFNTMQDIVNAGYCNALTESGRQLGDIRDGKKYWVAKLKDGNCWMTQNLDYDDPDGVRITSTTGTSGGPSSDWKNDNTIRQYWDPGEKIVNGSTLAAATGSTDRHLLVGNYYSWLSATNGTGKDVSTDGANASGSICPDGWKLPTSTASGQFQLLVNQGKSSWTQYPSTNINGYWLGGTTANASGAAFFTANGRVGSGKLANPGSYGYYWSSTANSGTNAYSLTFHSSGVSPSNYNGRYNGVSVRCVAR